MQGIWVTKQSKYYVKYGIIKISVCIIALSLIDQVFHMHQDILSATKTLQ